MDMIVAAGGGERDAQVDLNVAANVDKAAKAEAFVNERLMNDLRPTLFLAQLSNLLAGNISIVHGVTGSSRTFMGEESAGVEAVRVAHARIQAGQSDLALVGGAYNAERWEVMLHFALGRRLARGEAKPAWERGGMELGTIGAFLVLEEKAHAQSARRKTVRAHRGGRVGSRQARAGRGHGGAGADVEQDRAAARCRAVRGHLRRVGRCTRDARKSAPFSPAKTLPFGRPGPISVMGSSRSFRLTSRSRRRRCAKAGCIRAAHRSRRWTAA